MKKSHLLALILLFSFVFDANAQTSKVNALADRYVKRLFDFYPETGTFYGVANANNAGLSDNSAAGVQKWQLFEDSLYSALKTIDVKSLTKADRVTYGILFE